MQLVYFTLTLLFTAIHLFYVQILEFDHRISLGESKWLFTNYIKAKNWRKFFENIEIEKQF